MSGIVSDNIDRQSGVIAEPSGGAEVRSDDPSASEGTVWFNTTSGVLKVFRNIAAWSAGGTYPSTHSQMAATGIISAVIAAGGTDGSNTQSTSYEYNGTAWATNIAINTACSGPSRGGTQTSALIAGGITDYTPTYTSKTESYNGASWTAETAYGGGTRATMAGCGASETAIVVTVGKTASGHNYTNATYEYDGTSWSAGGNSNYTGQGRYGTGVQTAAVFAGGKNAGGYTATSEEYNGASHTAGNSMATARGYHGAAGTMTDALMFDGDSVTTEIYNGTSYSAGTANDGRVYAGGHGASSTSAYCVGGQADGFGDVLNTTQEFAEAVTARTVTDS